MVEPKVQKIPEGASALCAVKERQPRMEWYQVLDLARDIADAAESAGIDSKNLVFVGGIAVFLHARNILGNRAVPQWRGTVDVDVVVTERGGVGKLLANLQNSGRYEYIDPLKSHFPDKQAWRVQAWDRGFLPERKRLIDVDIYFPNPGPGRAAIEFNARRIHPFPEPFIREQVESYVITRKGRPIEVAVPSLLDCLIMKLDVAAVSEDFRDKDRMDILTLLMVAEQRGLDGVEILTTAVEATHNSRARRFVLSDLASVTRTAVDCYQKGNFTQEQMLFFPSLGYLKQAAEVVMRRYENL